MTEDIDLSGLTVLYCHPGAELYGSDRMAHETVRALRARGATVAVVLPNAGPLADLLELDGLDVRIFPVPVLRKEFISARGVFRLAAGSLGALRTQLRLIREVNADIVWANTLIQPTWMLAGRLAGIRSVCHVREAERDRGRLIRAALVAPLTLAHAVVANSEDTRAFIMEAPLRPRKGGVRVIYNGKNWDPYYRSRPGCLSEGDLNLVVVGRLSPRKGQDLAIRALASLVTAGVNARLKLAGDVFPGYEWFKEELETTAVDLGVKERVDFLGFTDSVPQVLETASIAIVPSRVEPFGTVAAESMAAMRPTVAAAVDGLLEVIPNASVGRTFEPDDWRDLTRVIRDLVREGNGISVAEAGRQHVLQRFSGEQYETGICRLASEVAS